MPGRLPVGYPRGGRPATRWRRTRPHNSSRMARAVWSGTISFGLVSVPVRLYPATRRKDMRFHEIDRLSGQRIRHQRVVEPAPTRLAMEPQEWSRTAIKPDAIGVSPSEPLHGAGPAHLVAAPRGPTRP